MQSIQYGMDLFETAEPGHPIELAEWLREVVRSQPWKRKPPPNVPEALYGGSIQVVYRYR